LLASILTVTAAFTINLRIQGSANVPLLGVDTIYTPFLDPTRNQLETWFGDTGIQIHRNVVTALVCGVVLVIVIVLLQLFFRTEVGIALRSTGANAQMSRAQGIDTRVYVIGASTCAASTTC
jgi:putative ABC transport system permease protein